VTRPDGWLTGRAVVRRDHDERGAIALEFMLVIGTLMGVFLLMLQYAVRAHAERIAAAAAEEGLAAASAYDGTAADGRRVANDYLHELGPGLSHASVEVTRERLSATVSVSGRVDQLVPLLPVTIHVEVEGPVERFVAESPGFTP
jgi:Flp pilus assembly protein TadG